MANAFVGFAAVVIVTFALVASYFLSTITSSKVELVSPNAKLGEISMYSVPDHLYVKLVSLAIYILPSSPVCGNADLLSYSTTSST